MAFQFSGDATARPPPKPPHASEVALVSRVVDGDTLELSDGRKVRLLGVDTPELHHPLKPVQTFALEAAQFTNKHILHETVRLEFESRMTDKYGRVLAYVFRGRDGFFLNRELVAQGYAHVEVRWPFRYLELFRALERTARESGFGLWAQP